ncbi:MAG: GreA/GreB family elongation factor [Candidatus Uhrbacteria bacterium]
MQVPKRKAEEDRRKMQVAPDRYLSTAAILRMKKKLDRLKKIDRPAGIIEQQRTAEMGDFSENVAYQEAKWKLRRINSQIDSLEDKITNAIPIKEGASEHIRIGSTVVLQSRDKELTLQIVGAQEADPSKGRISHQSPVGTSLLGNKISDHIMIADLDYQIIEIR